MHIETSASHLTICWPCSDASMVRNFIHNGALLQAEILLKPGVVMTQQTPT